VEEEKGNDTRLHGKRYISLYEWSERVDKIIERVKE
jgi:hypothetical protein